MTQLNSKKLPRTREIHQAINQFERFDMKQSRIKVSFCEGKVI